MIRVRLKEIPPAGHGENTHTRTHSPEPSAVNHTLTAPPFFLPFHFSLFIYFFPSPLFSFLLCSKECSLYRVAGVHWSASTPMSHTHPMCLLLATLNPEREGRRERGREREREGRGRGGRGRRERGI